MADKPQIQRSYTHDYKSPCIYMLTVTVEGREPLLGKLVGDVSTAHIELSLLGEAVRYELYALCQRYPQLRLLQYQVMPDHVVNRIRGSAYGFLRRLPHFPAVAVQR